MLNSCKFADALTDAVHINASAISHGNCCHYILKVMKSKKLQVSCLHYRNLFCLGAKNDLVSLKENTLFQSSCAGEIYGLRYDMLTKLAENLILIIQYAHILRALVAGDQLFHTDVLCHGMMAVQMILCNVQNGAYLGSKFGNGLKLEAADLCNCNGVVFHLQCLGGVWGTDISYYKNRLSCILHDLAKKSGCGCFAVGSSNGKNLSLSGLIGELNLSPYRKSLVIKALYNGKICRNPRA